MDLRTKRELLASEVHEFRARVQATDFWNLVQRDEDLRGCVGTPLLLEGRTRNHYQAIEKLVPPAGEFLQLCQLIERLGGVRASMQR